MRRSLLYLSIAWPLAGCPTRVAAPNRDEPQAASPSETAADLDECDDFMDRWTRSSVSLEPVAREVPSHPYASRGVVIGHRSSLLDPFPPQLVTVREAIERLEGWCHFSGDANRVERARRGACFVRQGDGCWYALRRTGNDFQVVGYFAAGAETDPSFQADVDAWLDVVHAVFGPVR